MSKIIELKNLPLETNWNLIWLKSKNHSLVAKAFKDHILNHKDEIIKNKFSWINDY